MLFSRGRRLAQFGTVAKARIRVCRDCGFIGPDFNYSFELLSNLYCDYRSETYNAERVLYEPDYKNIEELVGKHDTEITERLRRLNALIDAHVDFNKITTVMDWGGGEGKFVPTSLTGKHVFVFDISSEPLVNRNFCRVDRPPGNMTFDYIQLCHVLEHVASPYNLVCDVLSHLRPGGYLYIEVPQERTEEEIRQFVSSSPDMHFVIHEHLNIFTRRAVKALANSHGLREISLTTASIDLGWIKSVHVSGLFSKQESPAHVS
jgi:SAM-dependent methyltransferase